MIYFKFNIRGLYRNCQSECQQSVKLLCAQNETIRSPFLQVVLSNILNLNF